MTDIARPAPPDKPAPACCRDPVIARAILGLIATVDAQRTQIAIIERRLAEVEHGLHLVENEQERGLTR